MSVWERAEVYGHNKPCHSDRGLCFCAPLLQYVWGSLSVPISGSCEAFWRVDAAAWAVCVCVRERAEIKVLLANCLCDRVWMCVREREREREQRAETISWPNERWGVYVCVVTVRGLLSTGAGEIMAQAFSNALSSVCHDGFCEREREEREREIALCDVKLYWWIDVMCVCVCVCAITFFFPPSLVADRGAVRSQLGGPAVGTADRQARKEISFPVPQSVRHIF